MNNNSPLLKDRKIARIVLLITLLISFASMFFINMKADLNLSFRIREMLFLILSLTTLAVPIEIFIYTYCGVKCKNIKREFESKYKDLITKVSIIFIFCYFIYSFNMVEVSGVSQINRKFKKENSYYIQLKNKEIKCTKDQYDFVKESGEYSIRFQWNKLLRKGKIYQIY